MRITIRVKEIVWGDRFLLWYNKDRPVYPGADGAVRYELKFYRTEEELKALECPIENPYVCHLYLQPFSKNGTYQTAEGKNVWQWDGNKESPTLSPSWRVDDGRGMIVHLLFQNGKINLLADSTVTLET